MFFGLTVSLNTMLVLGAFLFAILVAQTLIGQRVIKLGRVQWVWHRRLGFAILALAALHGLAGVALYFGWRVI